MRLQPRRRALATKNQTPPRYALASNIEVRGGSIVQAKSVSVSNGRTYRMTNATMRNGINRMDSTRVYVDAGSESPDVGRRRERTSTLIAE
jgi:hypothetical protein